MQLNRSLAVTLLFLALGACGAPKEHVVSEAEAQNLLDHKTLEIEVEAGRDRVKVVMPKKIKNNERLPLVVLLHGYSASGLLQDAYFGTGLRVASKGYVLALPNGTKNSDGKRFWNAFAACCDFENQNVDDVGFLKKLVEKVKEKISIDDQRITFLGHSNGGFMSYRMACEAPDMVAGVAVLAGSMSSQFDEYCAKAKPISVLHVHGMADDTVFYNGGSVGGPQNEYLSAPEVAKTWAFSNNCQQHQGSVLPILDFISFFQVKGLETFKEIWSDCANETSVELLSMQKGQHTPIFTPDFIEYTLNFLLKAKR